MREEPQQGPWADTMHGGPWTRHGHSIPSLTVLAEIRPRNVYRCGGVRMCRTCQADAEAARGVTTSAPELSPAEAAIVARFDAAPAAPESFDPIAALRRGDAVLDGLDLQFRDDYTLTVVSRVRDALGPQEPSARHRPLGGGRCVCGQPIHTEADR